MNCSTPSLIITNSRSSPKPMSTESVMPSNHIMLCYPLLLLPPIFPSIRVFSNDSALGIRWSKYWSFSFNISPPNEHPGLISFRMDWLNLIAVQGTLKSLLLHWQIEGKTMETVTDFIFLGSKITADGDCSREIKRRVLLGRKVMTNLESILKCRHITLSTNVF